MNTGFYVSTSLYFFQGLQLYPRHFFRGIFLCNIFHTQGNTDGGLGIPNITMHCFFGVIPQIISVDMMVKDI